MSENKLRSNLEIARRSYSDEEVSSIYELARFLLENGDLRKAETILLGLTEVAALFAPGWLGLAYIHVHNKDWDAAAVASRHALRADPRSVQAMLYLGCCLLTAGDFNAAGALLGEVGDLLQSGEIDDTTIRRFYRAQIARFDARS